MSPRLFFAGIGLLAIAVVLVAIGAGMIARFVGFPFWTGVLGLVLLLVCAVAWLRARAEEID